ncbi:oligoribonuclease [Polyangium jinanense]|uniref:Oligoribonuclease n=1 Tax=Polyangium jinanense TaxID=2829994 RepID=A0A9X4AP56_9BACT|nr:oligoribonuclease [Polyangium jinanense]MDC3953195.1 oligoribonuclease [Polyangium jinanense]MDC3979684.1 oligoribonuclease [Polyangium jinanense]
MAEPSDRLVWVDLEMTGLDPQRCAIVEIATIITDCNLRVVEEGPNLVIHQPPEVLATMNDFVRELHARSGLLERIPTSRVTLDDAAAQTLAFVQKHVTKGTAPLCGNSVWKDREFLERYMPAFVAHLHYRMIDVSTLKELVKRWCPERQAPKKKETHRALDDIRESIEELAHYQKLLFAPLARLTIPV